VVRAAPLTTCYAHAHLLPPRAPVTSTHTPTTTLPPRTCAATHLRACSTTTPLACHTLPFCRYLRTTAAATPTHAPPPASPFATLPAFYAYLRTLPCLLPALYQQPLNAQNAHLTPALIRYVYRYLSQHKQRSRAQLRFIDARLSRRFRITT